MTNRIKRKIFKSVDSAIMTEKMLTARRAKWIYTQALRVGALPYWEDAPRFNNNRKYAVVVVQYSPDGLPMVQVERRSGHTDVNVSKSKCENPQFEYFGSEDVLPEGSREEIIFSDPGHRLPPMRFWRITTPDGDVRHVAHPI